MRPGRVLTLGLGLAALIAGGAAAQEVGLPIGTEVEAVQIEDLDGEPVDLAEYIGEKPVLFEFWATWCPL